MYLSPLLNVLNLILGAISGFRRDVDDICALLGGLHMKHAVSTWNLGTVSAFASVPSSRLVPKRQ
jgi:hypothetical protein